VLHSSGAGERQEAIGPVGSGNYGATEEGSSEFRVHSSGLAVHG